MQTVLIIKNSYLTVSTENEELLNGISNILTFADTSKAFVNGRFDKHRVKQVKFAKKEKNFEIPTLKIPIGFLNFIQSVLEDFEHSCIDDRPNLDTTEYIDTKLELNEIQLYDHQKKAIKRALSNRRGIVKSPTGSGKTEIFLAILKMLKEPTLVVFNRTQLAHQTMERATKRGIDAGIVQGKNVLEKHVTMATIQSIEKIENIRKYKNLICDEVHNSSSRSYQNILKKKHWHRIYGFSATPVNPNKMEFNDAKIISNVGPVIYEAKAQDLIDKGIIAKPKINMIPITKPNNIDEFGYRAAEIAGIINNKYRNQIIQSIVNLHSKEKILILTKYVDQGKNIQKLVPGAPFIWNKTKVKERLDLIKQFEKSDSAVLIASRILDEGIDIKDFTVLIIASAGTKFTRTIQRLGRGLRVTSNKDEIIVYDFIDDTQGNLYKHSKNRIKLYKKYGFTDIKEWQENDLHILRS